MFKMLSGKWLSNNPQIYAPGAKTDKNAESPLKVISVSSVGRGLNISSNRVTHDSGMTPPDLKRRALEDVIEQCDCGLGRIIGARLSSEHRRVMSIQLDSAENIERWKLAWFELLAKAREVHDVSATN